MLGTVLQNVMYDSEGDLTFLSDKAFKELSSDDLWWGEGGEKAEAQVCPGVVALLVSGR